MGARVGKPKAITATARKLGLLVYRMLRYRTLYHALSAADYDRQQRSRILRGLRKRAASLGFELVDTQTGLVM
jgi:transposase